MRGFVFTVDMLYGSLVVILLFFVLMNTPQNTIPPEQVLLQIQAKDAVMAWFYSSPLPDSSLLNQCPADDGSPSTYLKSCACDTAFRPRVTTSFQNPSLASSWVRQTVCVVAP